MNLTSKVYPTSKVYWRLTKRDGSFIDIPPIPVEGNPGVTIVDLVKRRWDNRLPIHTQLGSVPVSEIKSFEPSDRPYSDTPLLEAASRAFNEPLYNEDGSIQAKWVKKQIPMAMYNKHYSHISAYKQLSSDGTWVTIAFRVPTHAVPDNVEYCTNDDIKSIDKNNLI